MVANPTECEEQAKDGYFDAELRARYLSHLGHGKRRIVRRLAAASAAIGSATVVGLLASGPRWVAVTGSLISTGLTATGLLVGNDSKEESGWLELASGWSERSADWNQIWKGCLAGIPATPNKIAKARKLDFPLRARDGEFPRHKRVIKRFQREITRAEGY